MFDLNLVVDDSNDSSESTQYNEDNVKAVLLEEGCSGTSNNDDSSSVIYNNVTAEEDDFDSSCFYGKGNAVLTTRELFPIPIMSGSSDGGKFGEESGGQNSNLGELAMKKKSRRGPRSKSSQYRGVTFYRRTGRWESHIWDCGKQVYLGGFDTAHAAARAYDRAAIKFRGVDADINFNLVDYNEDMKQLKNLSKEEFVHILRRQSTGFSRGSSKYRGVTLHKCGRWEARMGQFLGKKAYDKAALKCNGREAVTNFEPVTYEAEMMCEAINEGSSHNLDLNLGISLPSNGTGIQKKEPTLLIQKNNGPHDATSGRLSRMKPVVSAMDASLFNRPAMTSQNVPAWTGVYQPCFPNHQELASNRSEGGYSQQSFPSWGWQTYGQFNANAASSGFSSATMYPTIISNPQAQAVCAPLSQYYYQMKPPS